VESIWTCRGRGKRGFVPKGAHGRRRSESWAHRVGRGSSTFRAEIKTEVRRAPPAPKACASFRAELPGTRLAFPGVVLAASNRAVPAEQGHCGWASRLSAEKFRRGAVILVSTCMHFTNAICRANSPSSTGIRVKGSGTKHEIRYNPALVHLGPRLPAFASKPQQAIQLGRDERVIKRLPSPNIRFVTIESVASFAGPDSIGRFSPVWEKTGTGAWKRTPSAAADGYWLRMKRELGVILTGPPRQYKRAGASRSGCSIE